MQVPVVFYADFESCIQPIDTCQPSSNEFYTNKIQKHKPLSFCIVIKWTDNIVPLKTITYTAKSDDEDVGQIFVDMLERNVKRIYKIQQEKINQFKYIKKEDREKYEPAIKSATTCHICEKELGEDRVIDHCHLTGKFRGAAHTKCNRNYKIPNFIPVFFHNLSGYDSHLFIKKVKN